MAGQPGAGRLPPSRPAGAGRPSTLCPRCAYAAPSGVPRLLCRVRGRKALPGRGEPRAYGERSKKRFISETKAYFFQAGLLVQLPHDTAGPGPGAGVHRPLTRSPAPPPLSGPDIKAGALHKRIKAPHTGRGAGSPQAD